MTKVDQFESAFRSASKQVFSFQPVTVGSVLLVTDLEAFPAEQLEQQVKSFIHVLQHGDQTPSWKTVTGDAFDTVRDLLDVVEAERPDLICTYRHVGSPNWRWPFTLGEHLEVLTQATTTPVLVLPHPESIKTAEHAVKNTNSVMAMTDHLTGDDRLVNFAATFTQPGGVLFLTHMEDDRIFQRYVDTIGKIPEIDTDSAREVILNQLLKEPTDYIESCRKGLHEHDLHLTVEAVVRLGRHLSDYRAMVIEHEVDLLVVNTKDADQMAMHGLAHPLAVELREIPLLML